MGLTRRIVPHSTIPEVPNGTDHGAQICRSRAPVVLC
jgi:hypothetical protein